MNMTTTINDINDMTMSMTFSGWNTYKLKILFDFWDITTIPQFAGSCIFIGCITIFHKWIVYVSYNFNSYFITYTNSSIMTNSYVNNYSTIHTPDDTPCDEKIKLEPIITRSIITRPIIKRSINSINFGLSLLIMLFSMTYNPYIFVSIMVGHVIGDCFFYVEGLHEMTECH